MSRNPWCRGEMNQPQRRHTIVAGRRWESSPLSPLQATFQKGCHVSRRTRPVLQWGLGLSLLLFFGLIRPSRADIDEKQFEKDLQSIAAPSSRVIGSAGYDA